MSTDIKEPTVVELSIWSDSPGLWSIQYYDEADDMYHQFDEIPFQEILVKLSNLGF